MARRDGRRRYEEELDSAHAVRSPERDAAADSAPEHMLLPLQRSAGNQAVGAMLEARSTLARQPAGATEAEPMDVKKGETKGKVHVTVTDIGEFEALSLQLGPKKAPERDREEKEKEKDEDKDKGKKTVFESITVTKAVDDLTPKLFQFSLTGNARLVTIEYGPVLIRIPDALISNYQQSTGGGDRPIEQITFNGTVEVEFRGGAAE
jgi:hypothetical protein